MSLGMPGGDAPARRIWPALLRWTTAALVVVSAHGGLAWVALSWRPNEAAAGAPEPAVMIELAAVSVAPEAPPSELPPAPQPTETEPEPPPPEPEPEPIKEAEPPPPEPEPEPEPVQLPEPEIKLPEIPQLPDPAAVLAPPPPPKPPERPKVVERKPVPPKPKVVERRRPVERQKPRAERAVAPPPSPAQAAAPASAPAGSSAAPAQSTASWRGMLIAHLNRYKRFPPGARTGTAQVAFSIDRGGRVLSARLAGSSGDPALDDEAVSMIRRASPVPAPPSGVGGGGAIALAVPVRFNR